MARTRVRWSRVMTLLVALLALIAAIGGAAAGADDGRPGPRYLVQAGDTLWGVARGIVGPEGDPRPVVEELRDLNGLGPGHLQAGTTLILP